MLAIDCTYTTQESAVEYGEVLLFDWPHEARDIYKITLNSTSTSSTSSPAPASTAVSSGNGVPHRDKMYSFTHEYELRYNELKSWSLKPGAKCLFQRPRLNLNYCDILASPASNSNETGNKTVGVSECCFLCDADVTTLGSAKVAKEHRHGEAVEASTPNLIDPGTVGGSSRIESNYAAALGAVYPNILLDM